MFYSLIINNPQLKSDCERFFYLKSFLRSEALKCIDSLFVTNENFEIAINILKKTHENKNKIVNEYFHELSNIPIVNKCNSQNLREFVINCRKNWESIQKLDFDDKTLLEALFTFHYQQKLAYSSRKGFEEGRDRDHLPQVDELFDFIDEKCVIVTNVSSVESKFDKKSRKVPLHSSDNNFAQHNANQNVSCVYCKLSHRIYTCQLSLSLLKTD